MYYFVNWGHDIRDLKFELEFGRQMVSDKILFGSSAQEMVKYLPKTSVLNLF